MPLLQNILNNYKNVQNDFIGISINISGIAEFSINLIIATAIIVVYYLFGEKIRRKFFSENNEFSFFIAVLLGYGVIGSGLAILGMLSLFRIDVLVVYFIVVTLIALFSFSFRSFRKSITSGSILKKFKLKEFAVWGVLIFVIISLLRLTTPEITEDAYHTDLPQLYLSSGTSMHENKHPLLVITYPQLAEMSYILPLFLDHKEVTRFLHFAFYILIILLLFTYAKSTSSSFAKFAPLLFVTAPVVIRYAPSQYTDFFMVLPFLTAIFIIKKSPTRNNVLLAGIIFGCAMATKLWVLIYLPVFLLYIYFLLKRKKWLKKVIFFTIGALIFPSIWYIRSFILTGNPIYPVLAKVEWLEKVEKSIAPASNYVGFNINMFSLGNLVVLSPLFFLSALLLLAYFNKAFKTFKKLTLPLFFLILFVEQLVIKVDLGRYLVGWYSVATVVISAGIAYGWKNIFIKVAFIAVFIVLVLYYLINTLLYLPYGFGWADKNKYLTRVLFRDNASYYDFNRQFETKINKNDTVGTYGVFGFYYADFKYVDIHYVISLEKRSFDELKGHGVTKLLIKDGDITWFCQKLSLSNCNENKVKLLTAYPQDIKKYYLYSIK